MDAENSNLSRLPTGITYPALAPRLQYSPWVQIFLSHCRSYMAELRYGPTNQPVILESWKRPNSGCLVAVG